MFIEKNGTVRQITAADSRAILAQADNPSPLEYGAAVGFVPKCKVRTVRLASGERVKVTPLAHS